MDQGTGDSTHGQSPPVADDTVVKVELPWFMKEEPEDQPSAVYSTVQPLSDNTSGSLLSLNTSHVCQRCSASFKLRSSLETHMETFHGETLHSELPVAARLHDSASERTEKMPSEEETFSTQMTDEAREDSVTSNDFVIKLEPPCSMKEEPPDQPSAVRSPVQPVSDNTSGSLLSLNTSHACQRCSATFVLFSSLELHMATFHGETLRAVFPMHAACCDVGDHPGCKNENGDNCNMTAVKGRKQRVEDSDRTDQGEQSSKHVCSKAFHNRGGLQTHKVLHTGLRPFMCDVCGKAFNNRGSLKTHKCFHTGDRPFVCDVCSKAFKRAFDLKMHKEIHTGLKPFVCDVCNKAFTTAGNLKKHKKLHTKDGRKFECGICQKTFAQVSHLRNHMVIHTGQKPFVCDVCNKAFSYSNNLHAHKLIHTGLRRFVCDMCKKAFVKSHDLKRHMRIHTHTDKSKEKGKPRDYVCDVCKKAFTRPYDLKRHSMIHSGHKPFVCDVCRKAFTYASVLKKHKENRHSKERESPCDVYSKHSDDFLKPISKNQNQPEPPCSMKEEPPDQPSAVHSPVLPMSDNTSGSLLSLNTSHACQRCSATFVLFSSLELHMATFHGETLHDVFPMYSAYKCSEVGYHQGRKNENVGNSSDTKAAEGRKETVEDSDTDMTDRGDRSRKYACDLCSKVFARPYELNRHRSTHTGDKPFACDVCSKAFSRTCELKRHKLLHTGHKSFVCDVCTKAFSRAYQLKIHRMTHTGHRPFACDVCSKAFITASQLKTHKLFHTDHKAFACQVCSKAFATATSLKGHMVIHSGHKPYICGECGKAFTKSNDLTRHMITHTGQKPFRCNVCHKAYSDATYFKKHLLAHANQTI